MEKRKLNFIFFNCNRKGSLPCCFRFIHQLAYSKQIKHIVSIQALRKLYREVSSSLNLKLNSYVFMESVIERAKSDQINPNQTTLLYDIVNIKNDYNKVID